MLDCKKPPIEKLNQTSRLHSTEQNVNDFEIRRLPSWEISPINTSSAQPGWPVFPSIAYLPNDQVYKDEHCASN